MTKRNTTLSIFAIAITVLSVVFMFFNKRSA